MSNGDKKPSQKSLGKRPVHGVTEPPGTQQAPPKRVLPSRSRRGGPGIGSCDVDSIILDAQKRKFDNEPLVPASTQILLTTNSKLVSSSSVSKQEINDNAFERYFDRPEVSKAFKLQQIIETPEFSLLSEDASVGGRFRPRAIEDELADTSDATYEKRHRKYETFEKRQRLREKEKLKHEQYKLKERIDQLRGMDGSAFLALPAAIFSGSSNVVDNEDPGINDLPGIHINGAALHNESEKRRSEILDTAAVLEERYRILLPPDRIKPPEKERKRTATPSVSVDGEQEKSQSPSQELEADVIVESSQLGLSAEKLKLKIKVPQRETPGVDTQESVSRRRSTARLSAPPVSRPKTRSSVPESPARVSPIRSPSVNFQKLSSPSAAEYIPPPSSPLVNRAPRKKIRRGPDISKSFTDDVDEESDHEERTDSGRRVRNRISTSDVAASGALMTAALRSTGSGRKAQRTQRHVTAFGMKVHSELDDVRDFEIPYWIKEAVHIMDDQSDVPPEGHSDTWFAEQVNGGRHVVQSAGPSLGEETLSLLDDELLSLSE